MSGSGDPELGLINYERQLSSDENISDEAATIAAYGIYLMHGGTKENFMKLNPNDIQTIYSTYTAMEKANTTRMMKGICEILKAL